MVFEVYRVAADLTSIVSRQNLSVSYRHLLGLSGVSTVDSRYLDPSYLDPITYVELISKSRLFSYIYCISPSRMSNYFYVDTSAISSIIFSP